MITLALGMSGDDVLSLQLALVDIGLLGGQPTGQFDDITQKAVVEVQRQAGLPQTGVVEDRTWDAVWRAQAGVAPAPTTYTPGRGPAAGQTTLATTDVVGQPPARSALLFAGLLFGGIYWFTHRHEAANWGRDDEDDEGDEGNEGDDEDDSFVEPERRERREAVGDYEDAVTDSLIDEPATISASGRPGDCKKAAMRLMRVQALVQRPSERSIYDRVVRKVASNCRGAEEAIEEAIEEAAGLREEAEREVGARLIRSPLDVQRGTSHEHGFRKSKKKLTRKTTSEGRPEGVRGRGRRGASAISVRRGGKEVARLRKEKSKTKRGYTWRKETED